MAEQSLPKNFSTDNLDFAPIPSHPRFVNLTGRSFGLLLVLGYKGNVEHVSYWWCQCDCGSVILCRYGNLQSGNSTSCGCVRRDAPRLNRRTTFNYRDTAEYSAWRSLRNRCNNPSNEAYSHYGGRGIRVCDRWKRFEYFLADVGPRPTAEHSIERKDVNGNYEPSNCVWATREQQMNNRRVSRLLTLNGKTQTIAQWARDAGMPDARLRKRVESGWSKDCLFIEPIKGRPKRQK